MKLSIRNISNYNVIMKILMIIVYNSYNYSQRQFSSSGHSQVVPWGFRAAQSAWQQQWFACSQGCCLVTHRWEEAVFSLVLQHHLCLHALHKGRCSFFSGSMCQSMSGPWLCFVTRKKWSQQNKNKKTQNK